MNRAIVEIGACGPTCFGILAKPLPKWYYHFGSEIGRENVNRKAIESKIKE